MEVATDIFAGLMGQVRAREFLSGALANGKLPQTLLFVGPKGVGRKTAAQILARTLHGTITAHHPDTFIFSNVLAEMREQTREGGPMKNTVDAGLKFLSMSPIASTKKVAIIDDADNLSDTSQNALLKTLEEPLTDSVLILISEDERRLLPTIVSRAVIVRFAPLSTKLLREAAPAADDTMLTAAQGSLGRLREWLADPDKFAEVREMSSFWEGVLTSTTEDKITWAERVKDRETTIRFLEEGLRVWRERWLTESSAADNERLIQFQTAIRQVKDNANPRVALEALLFGL